MILAVYIFRFCDSMRKKKSSDSNISAFRPFETHFMAMIVGKLLLEKNNFFVDDITHKNFHSLLDQFEESKDLYFSKGENLLLNMLQSYFDEQSLQDLDGRTIAAPFRYHVLIGRYIENKGWWDKNK